MAKNRKFMGNPTLVSFHLGMLSDPTESNTKKQSRIFEFESMDLTGIDEMFLSNLMRKSVSSRIFISFLF
jgi:hypothetical protein